MSFQVRAGFFLTVGGNVVRADKLLDIKTLDSFGLSSDGCRVSLRAGMDSCRANHANQIKGAMSNLADLLAAKKASISLVAPKAFRAADGPVYFNSMGYWTGRVQKAIYDEFAAKPDSGLFDLIVANTCTMIGMGPHAATGLVWPDNTTAGCLEYRSLTNFYLGAYPLTGLVLNLIRFTILVLVYDPDGAAELLSKVKRSDVIDAIESGDRQLAAANWAAIEATLMQGMTDYVWPSHPLCPKHLNAFRHFIKQPTGWWSHNLLTHWSKLPEAHTGGWEDFLSKTVAAQLKS